MNAKRGKLSTPTAVATPSPQPNLKKRRNAEPKEATEDKVASREATLLENDAVLQRALASQIAATPQKSMTEATFPPLQVDGYEDAFSPAKPMHLFQTPDKSIMEAATQVYPTPDKSIVEADTQVCPTPPKSSGTSSHTRSLADETQTSPSPTVLESPAVPWNCASVCVCARMSSKTCLILVCA